MGEHAHTSCWCSLVIFSLLTASPRFTRTPEDQTGVQGGVASFVCQAAGDPQPKIIWNKKGKKVSNQRFEVIEFDDGSGSVLRIQPLRTPRDEAIYECHASNSAGEITASTRLSVLREDQLPPGFPTIDMGPQLKVVERSRTATMLCAASGNPDPEISWFKDFLPVNTSSNNGRIKQLRSGGTPIRGALQIEMSEESDQGKYECVATNSDGTRYSTPANLYVRVRRVPPRFSIPPADSEIMPGGNINITCVAVGSPMPYVKWMLGAEDLTPEDDMPIGRNVLELTDVRQSNNYTCVAMSTLGVIEAMVQITVKALPKAPGMPMVTERTATSITLTWDSGNPEPVSYYVIQYRGKGSEDPFKEIDGIATTRYSVGGLSPYSHYDFRVAAFNTIGQGPPSEVVEARTAEQAPSSPPRQVIGRMLSATTAMIHWDEPEEPNGQVVGYRVYYTSDNMLPVNQWDKQMVRSTNFITIQDLTPNKTYYIRVLAFTSVGDGPLSQDLQIIAKTGVPSQPSEFKGEAKSETSILLSWLAPSTQGGPESQITGYELVYRRVNDSEEKKVTFEPTTSYLLKNLKPFSTYTFQLAAKSKNGIGAYTNEVSIGTPQTPPSAPPQDISCTSPSSTSILVSWAPPPLEFRNGIITGYSIQYTTMEGNKTSKRIDGIPPESSPYLLENLEKWTEYGITVQASTEAGEGPESLQLLIRTEEDVPSGPPHGVEAETVNASAIRVKWRAPAPERQHGQIRGYQVHYVRMNYGEPQGQPSIKDILIDDLQWEYGDSVEYVMILGDLKSDTAYSVSVGAYTAKGDGARSKPITELPEKPRLMVTVSDSGTALLHWYPPSNPPTPILGYRLTFGRVNVLPFVVVEFPTKETRYTVQDIQKGAKYEFRLCSHNKMGYGEEAVKEVTTPEDAPSGYPENIILEDAYATSLHLAWKSVPLIEQNGKIVKYSVLYKDINSRGNASEVVVPAPGSSAKLEGLIADTVYDVRVCAFTAVGPGPYSPSVRFRTQRLDQVFATNFRVKASMKNSILLSWEIRDKNPSQPFTILYGKGQSVEVDGKQTQKLITGLTPDTLYSFLLTNRANSAGGLQHRVTATTAPDILKAKPTIVGKTNADGMVTVQLPTVQTTAKVRGYYVVVVPLKKQRGGKFLNPWEEPDQMNLDELLKEINRTSISRALRIRRQVGLSDPRAYVTAHFKTLPLEFTLGDGRNYGDFRNRPLQNGQEYVFFVLALLDLSENTMYATSPFSDPVTSSDVDPQPIVDEEEGLLWVVGPVLAVVFIVCIVIAILLFKRKRAEAEGRKASFPCSKAMSSHHPTDPVELRRINFQTPGMASHPPVPISELTDHIERLKANDNLKFSQEYESVDPGQQFTWENSNLEVNKPKNRYANVIAYDHSRVVLSSIEGVPGSDYINANYIDGYRRQNAYIATQGALPETFGDFWRMVWEQHSANIIMMTKLEEKSRVKCDQYWPTRGTETYGLIQVTLLDTVELATYSVRTFALYKVNGSNEKREVRHFQFTAWPDHGVPEHPTPFLAFLRRVKACNPPDAGPMVVHCSAGVGRTGCFIVIDAMTERIKHEKTIDVYGHVTLMRSQRNYMVQTEDQYIFIHDAVLEAVTCGNTEVPARNLYSYIQRLTQIEPGENVTGMELEFKRLASAKAHTSRFVSANLPCNKFKNRLVNIMPYETTRVCLQPIRGVEGSDYINASFIDGYRQQRAYIATQGPLAETTEDYWRMLWEHNSTIVVMLTKLREMGREKCHQYWPAERSARYQYFVVDPMAEYNMPQYILREFKVTDARDGQSRTVRQFQFTDWPEQGVPKSGEGFIDFIGQVHKTKEQFGQDGPITVHCSAGVGRTGVFITLSIVLERMRYEGVVDIFQTVKMLRTQRPATVQTEDQYQFCYRASLEYLGSFDHYAT
uniref:Receptor-type tyrosine-protein phosphatase delta n=2 Tax=Oryzias sinensis TaxID=183150 RepID=A0A8C7ZJ86_9TELE